MAISSAFSEIQELDCQPGLPKSSRVAVVVAESGFHKAMVPNQDGMVAGSTKTLERKLTGHTKICTEVTDSGLWRPTRKRCPSRAG